MVTRDRITDELIHVPLGTHANKQGIVVADSIAAELLGEQPRLEFPGIVQTAITKFCNLEISRTGLGEQQARDAGFDPVVASIKTTTIAGYLPDAGELIVLMVADRSTRRLLGVQIVGERNAGLRIDVAATAITAGMTVDDAGDARPRLRAAVRLGVEPAAGGRSVRGQPAVLLGRISHPWRGRAVPHPARRRSRRSAPPPTRCARGRCPTPVRIPPRPCRTGRGCHAPGPPRMEDTS